MMMAGPKPQVCVLFVCMGNICRSPAAEGLMKALVEEQGLDQQIFVDSAGTHGYHIGALPDPRMRDAAGRRGLDLTSRARKVERNDLEDFDWVIAMDEENLQFLEQLNRNPRQRPRLMSEFQVGETWPVAVPDPYYGDGDGFEYVLDMLQAMLPNLLDEIKRTIDVR